MDKLRENLSRFINRIKKEHTGRPSFPARRGEGFRRACASALAGWTRKSG